MRVGLIRGFGVLIVAVLASGCAGTKSAPHGEMVTASEPSAAGPAATTAPPAFEPGQPWPNSIVWTRTSAENRAIQLQVYRRATELVEAAAADREPGTWAVSLDADETVIDNSIYNIEIWEAGQVHSTEAFFAWAERLEAPPIPGSMAFLERVRELGGKIVIVTNRRMPICDATEENFRKHGIPYDLMLCRPTESDRNKTPRYEAVQAGTASPDLPPLEIVLWLGDAIGDFPNLSQEDRHSSDEAFSDFGVRFLQLPNPVYGDWMGNEEE